MTRIPPDLSQARRALARSIGLTAFVYGYPLTETYRTCRKQTDPRDAGQADARNMDARGMRCNTLHHGERPSTDADRDVVTPANDLLYTLSWIHL